MTDVLHSAADQDAQFAAEQAYLLAAQRGDYDAFDALCGLLLPGLRRFAARLIGPTDADDAVQLALLGLHRSLARIDPPSNLRAYVYRSVRNRCYDWLRSHGQTNTASLDEDPVELWVSFQTAETAPAADDAAYWLLLHLEVRDAIDRLPEAQRQTLILYAEEGFSYSEIAAIMGVAVGTVKSRLYQARAGLRGRLRPATLAALDEEFAEPPLSVTTPTTPNEGMNHGRTDDQDAGKSSGRAAGADQIDRALVSQRGDARNRRSGRARVSQHSQTGG